MAIEHFRLDGLSLTGFRDNLTNYVTNPSFEVDTTGWSTTAPGWFLNTGATLTRQTTPVQFGVGVGRIVTTAALSAQGAALSLGILPAGTYAFSGYLRGNAGGETVQLFGGHGSVANVLVNITLTTAWQRLSSTFVADGINACYIGVRTQTAAVRTFFVDGLMVVPGSTTPAYFEGSYDGYYWIGTEHASSSASSPFEIADAPVFVPAPLRLDWVGGPDSDGSVPLDAGHSENATLTLPLRVVQQTTADAAWAGLGLLLDKLEATRASQDGLELLWSPKNATDSWILTVQSGEITEMPMASRGDTLGYLLREPRFTVVFTCAPFLYRDGESVAYSEVTSTEPVFSIALASVPGHVDAEATITVTDNATQARSHVEWGLADTSAAALFVDSASLVTSGFAGTTTTRTGAYSSSGVIRATLATQPQAVCGTGNLTHIGVLRPKARIWASSLDVRVRFAYRTADGPYSYTPWQTPILEDDFSEVSFGVITIDTVSALAQQWDGRIEAYSATIGDTLDVDYIETLPAARWGKARDNYVYRPGVLLARDEFTAITAGTALNARAAPLGGTWATSGSTTDFAAADAPGTDESETRATTADSGNGRFAVLGSTNYTNVEVTAWGYRSAVAPAAGIANIRSEVIARWTDSSNHLIGAFASGYRLYVQQAVAGVFTTLQTIVVPDIAGAWFVLRLIVYASGRGVFTLLGADGSTVASINFYSSALATGGTLATGKPVLADYNSTATAMTRYYKNFSVATPSAEALTINSSRAIEIRHDSCERVSSDGLTYGRPGSYTGSRAFVPPAGDTDRTTRLWAKARRNDIDVLPDANIADSTKLKVTVRPRYRFPTSP